MDLSKNYSIKKLAPKDAKKMIAFWREFLNKALGTPKEYSVESQQKYLSKVLPEDNDVYIAIELKTEEPAGFMAINNNRINQLYVNNDHQNKGIGEALLKMAKEQSNGSLLLNQFEGSAKSQKFYERNGFRAIRVDNTDQTKSQELQYEWTQ